MLLTNGLAWMEQNDKKNMHLDKITAPLVNTAIEVYLRLAYGDAASRDKHTRQFPEDMPIEDVLSSFVSEDSSSTLRAWSLRLGSQEYPHMKLMLREAYLPDEFAFSVDRHDCFAFNRESLGHQRWLELQAQNHALKRTIEQEWYEEHIPTMRRLREKCLSKTDFFHEREKRSILLVDNDLDAVVIMELLLGRVGYNCEIAASVAEAIHKIYTCGKSLIGVMIDQLLPDGMGSDVVAALRGNPATQCLPAIIMSGMPQRDIELGAADEYLRKPFSADEVGALLDSVIRKYYESDTDFIGHDDLPE